MPLRLPPLNALRFFEAAARHHSFKLAAAELNVTPSAVSHGIVALETTLGVELFVREPRKLSLTPAGEMYLPYVAEAFSLIAIGTQRLPDKRTHRTLAVSCAPTLASRWLVPRLHAFRERWPNINVTVDTSRRQVGFPVDGFDFGIRLSRGPVAGATWTRLFGERLVPVCSAAYRDSLRSNNGGIDLHRATLIYVDTASEDWQAWFDGAGIDTIDAAQAAGSLRFDTVQLALEAASAGLGIAIGRMPLADQDLASARLVEACSPIVDTKTAYWLVGAEGADQRPDLLAFRRWLLEEAAAFAGNTACVDALAPNVST